MATLSTVCRFTGSVSHAAYSVHSVGILWHRGTLRFPFSPLLHVSLCFFPFLPGLSKAIDMLSDLSSITAKSLRRAAKPKLRNNHAIYITRASFLLCCVFMGSDFPLTHKQGRTLSKMYHCAID